MSKSPHGIRHTLSLAFCRLDDRIRKNQCICCETSQRSLSLKLRNLAIRQNFTVGGRAPSAALFAKLSQSAQVLANNVKLQIDDCATANGMKIRMMIGVGYNGNLKGVLL